MAFGPTSKTVDASELTDFKGFNETWPYAFLTFLLLVVGIVPGVVLGPIRPVLERLFLP